MLFLPNTTAEGKIRLLMSGHFGGEFQSSSIKTMARDDSAPAAPADCHHEVPEQKPATAAQLVGGRSHSDGCLLSFFPVALLNAGDRETTGQ